MIENGSGEKVNSVYVFYEGLESDSIQFDRDGFFEIHRVLSKFTEK